MGDFGGLWVLGFRSLGFRGLGGLGLKKQSRPSVSFNKTALPAQLQ